MADDARISTAFPHHPKTVKLQRRLGPAGPWSLVCLLLWVADNRPNGDLEGMTAEEIEIAAQWNGDSGAFVQALAEVRFLDGSENSYRVHDWAEHNPWAAGRPARVAAAREAAQHRWQKNRKPVASNAQSMPGACDSHESALPGACDSHESALPASPHLTTLPPKRKSSGADAPADPRHAPIREFIKRAQRETSTPEQWDGRSANELTKWLRANPTVTIEQAQFFVTNKFKSEESRGAPPFDWIPKLSKYCEGPLDKFGKPQQDWRTGYEGMIYKGTGTA